MEAKVMTRTEAKERLCSNCSGTRISGSYFSYECKGDAPKCQRITDVINGAKMQAEISFKAGQSERIERYEKRINDLQNTCRLWKEMTEDLKKEGRKEVVEWVEANTYLSELGYRVLVGWQAKLKEWDASKLSNT